MSINRQLLSEFIKVTNDNNKKEKVDVFGTIVTDGVSKYVKIDGSEIFTPISTVTDIKEGERVIVKIENHQAVVTGNLSDPSASGSRVDGTEDKIGEFDHIFAGNITADNIQAGAITADKILAGSITADKILADQIDANHIKADSIESKHIAADAIKAEHIAAGTITSDLIEAGTITADNIASGTITADQIEAGTITAGSGIIADGTIGTAQISSLDAAKISSGTIDTSDVTIAGANGNLRITGNRLQVFTGMGNQQTERVSLGDVNADGTEYGLRVRGADGTTILLDENGVTSEGITDGSITNDKINPNAAIDGGKLDIDSVITKINADGSKTINSIRIDVDGKGLSSVVQEINTTATKQGETIKTNTGSIAKNAEQIKLKVNQTTYTEDKAENTKKFTDIGTDITQLKDSVAIKVDKTEIEEMVIGSGNLLKKNNITLTSDGTTDDYLDNGKLFLENCSWYAGMATNMINIQTDTEVKKYIMSFKIRKVSGTLTHIGGHIDYPQIQSDHYFINGVKHYGPWSTPVNIPDLNTGEVNFIEVPFGYANTADGSRMSIQPNRGQDNVANVEITELKIVEGTKYSSGWNPNPEDLNVVITTIDSELSDIIVDLDNITQKVSSSETTQTQISKGERCYKLGAKINHESFSIANNGEIYLHGFDNDNNPTDTNGLIRWNDRDVVITKGMVKPNGIYYGSDCYLCTNSGLNGSVMIIYYNNSENMNRWEYKYLIGGSNVGYIDITNATNPCFGQFKMKDSENFEYVHLYDQAVPLSKAISIRTYETRMKYAESKITDESITNTVGKSFYSKNDIDSKGYQTESQVQQTVDKLEIKFEESGGYNLIRNSSFANRDYKCWWIWGDVGIWTNSSYYKERGDMFIYSNTQNAGGLWQDIDTPIRPNTTYTFSVLATKEESVKGGEFLIEYQSEQYGSVLERTTIPLNFDGKRNAYTFTTPNDSRITRCKLGIKHLGSISTTGGFLIRMNKPCLTEGHISVYSPHPSEVYDGITTIDKDGIEVNSSNSKTNTKMTADGFYIEKNNVDLFSVDQNGLVMNGEFNFITRVDRDWLGENVTNDEIHLKSTEGAYRCYNPHARHPVTNVAEPRSVYYTDRGISTTRDGDKTSSAIFDVHNVWYKGQSEAKGATLYSHSGIVGLVSNSNFIQISPEWENSGHNTFSFQIADNSDVNHTDGLLYYGSHVNGWGTRIRMGKSRDTGIWIEKVESNGSVSRGKLEVGVVSFANDDWLSYDDGTNIYNLVSDGSSAHSKLRLGTLMVKTGGIYFSEIDSATYDRITFNEDDNIFTFQADGTTENAKIRVGKIYIKSNNLYFSEEDSPTYDRLVFDEGNNWFTFQADGATAKAIARAGKFTVYTGYSLDKTKNVVDPFAELSNVGDNSYSKIHVGDDVIDDAINTKDIVNNEQFIEVDLYEENRIQTQAILELQNMVIKLQNEIELLKNRG